MPLPIIQTMWIGDRLSTIEALCASSFLYHGHEFHLYTYGNVDNVPAGVTIKDGNEIIPKNEIFTTGKTQSFAPFADWFRWVLLYKLGGFWVDMDVVCIKPFVFDRNTIFGLQGEQVCNAVISFPAGHELCKFMADVCDKPNTLLPYDSPKVRRRKILRRLINNSRSNIRWGETGGPEGFSSALVHFKLFHYAKPFTYFYPIHYSCWKSIFDSTLCNDTELFSETHAIHLWNEVARREQGFDKNSDFTEGSLIEQLKKKYLNSKG
ncbi:MAG: hypothetical protein K6L80_03690 [Agarilytica sp.]